MLAYSENKLPAKNFDFPCHLHSFV